MMNKFGDNIHKFAFCIVIHIPDQYWSILVIGHTLWNTHTHARLTALCKTSLDFTEARDSEWQWYQLGRLQICTSLQTDNHASTPPLSFLQAGYPSSRPTSSIKVLKAKAHTVEYSSEKLLDLFLSNSSTRTLNVLTVAVITGCTVSADNPDSDEMAGGNEGPASAAALEENWDDDILDANSDASPFGTTTIVTATAAAVTTTTTTLLFYGP